MDSQPPVALSQRVPAACGALLAAVSVGLAAYASHAADAGARERLLLAAVFGFGHGIALASLARSRTRLGGRIAMAAMLAGVLLFSGSLAAAHFIGVPTRLAPTGGLLMMAAWLVCAVDLARR